MKVSRGEGRRRGGGATRSRGPAAAAVVAAALGMVMLVTGCTISTGAAGASTSRYRAGRLQSARRIDPAEADHHRRGRRGGLLARRPRLGPGGGRPAGERDAAATRTARRSPARWLRTGCRGRTPNRSDTTASTRSRPTRTGWVARHRPLCRSRPAPPGNLTKPYVMPRRRQRRRHRPARRDPVRREHPGPQGRGGCHRRSSPTRRSRAPSTGSTTVRCAGGRRTTGRRAPR